jgi:hypothetical protein
MKKIIALLLTLLFVFGLASFAAAEWGIPGDKFDKNGFIGKDGKSMRIGYINTLVGEGATSDTNETFIYYADPSSDNVIVVPDESGTLVTTGSSAALTNASITNGADASIMVSSDLGSVIWRAHTLTGDVTATMANTGVTATTIAANVVGTNEANINTVSLTIAAGSTWNSVAVESGSTLMGFYITNAGAINTSTFANAAEWDGSTLKAAINAADNDDDTTFGATFLRP